MTTPPPPGPAASARVSSIAGRRRRAGGLGAARTRSPTHTPGTPSLRRRGDRVEAAWSADGVDYELRAHATALGLQVWQRTSLGNGATLEEAFVLHGRSECERWLDAAPSRFAHPVAHEEFRRLAHGSPDR